MILIYLGFVLGGAFGFSCICTAFWVGVNRKRGRLREDPKTEDTGGESEDSSHCEGSGDEDHTEEREGDGEGGDVDEGYEESDDDVDISDYMSLIGATTGTVSA